MKTTTRCNVCGNEFTRYHSYYDIPRYCSRKCSFIGNSKGGWIKHGQDGQDYFIMLVPVAERSFNPTTDKKGYIRRSHYVWNMAHPDDKVLPGQVIHHDNHDSMDDRIENLVKYKSSVEHNRMHGIEIAKGRPRDEFGRFI